MDECLWWGREREPERKEEERWLHSDRTIYESGRRGLRFELRALIIQSADATATATAKFCFTKYKIVKEAD